MEGIQQTRRLSKSPERFHNTIREYRLRANLSQRQLASRIGRNRSSVSAWERGQRLPTVLALFALARELSTLTEGLYFDLYRPSVGEVSSSPLEAQ